MIDHVAVQNTIADETDVELLRGTVMVLLGEVAQRRERFVALDPVEEPSVSADEIALARSRMGQTFDVEQMRGLARELYAGLEKLNLQIERRTA